MLDPLLQGDFGMAPTNFPALFLGLLLAFAGGHLLAWVYMTTHSGLSYSRSFVTALVIMPLVVSLVMHVLSNSLVAAFGMMAVFTIVRFRNMLRDTMDTTYILLVLVLGMACGSQKFSTAILGTLAVSLALVYLHATSFGTRQRYDLILNLHWARPVSELGVVAHLLHRHARRTHPASQRASAGDEGTDVSYWLLLRDPARVEELLNELRAVSGVSRVTSLAAEDESEV